MSLFVAREWPRLQSTLERPHWLRVDFDHWEDLSDGEEEEEEEEEEEGERGEKRAQAREKLAAIKEEQVEVYLLAHWSYVSVHCSRVYLGKDDIGDGKCEKRSITTLEKLVQ